MLPTRTPAVPGAALDHWQAAFLALLPTVQSVARLHFRHVRCPDTKLDHVAEAVALAWLWYLRLVRKGRDPAEFVVTFSQLVARSVASGRRLCGQEKAKDALSPVCQRRRNFVVAPLPDGTAMVGNVFDDALIDNTRTPVPDQVQFRVDFPRWRRSLGRGRRVLMDAMAVGHRTTDLAGMFQISQGRVSQVRRELCESWRAFCGDDHT
jgi:hypothetical protein